MYVFDVKRKMKILAHNGVFSCKFIAMTELRLNFISSQCQCYLRNLVSHISHISHTSHPSPQAGLYIIF